MRIGNVEIEIDEDHVKWLSGMSIDADGSPRAYGPFGKGLEALDYLDNAGSEGNWFGLVVDPKTKKPIIQGPSDPCPGYYISPTSLYDHTRKTEDPLRYVDSEKVPYIAVPPELLHHAGVHLGDVVLVERAGIFCSAVVADVGPHGKIGEGSIALAKALLIPSNAKRGGIRGGVIYTILLGTSRGWPRTQENVEHAVRLALG